MNLDKDKMASARRRESRKQHNLDYLFSGIRRELEGRLLEKISVDRGSVDACSNASSDASLLADYGRCLVIDFQSGDIKPPGYDNVNSISLLENSAGTDGGLAALDRYQL